MSKTPRTPLLFGTLLILVAVIGSLLPGRVARAQSTSLTFKPIADAFVISSAPTTNYGTATNLRVDADPVTRSYLRFSVSGLNGATIQSARMRIYANSSNPAGWSAHRLASMNWTETGITYNSAPPPGVVIKTSPAVAAGQWAEVDLTGYITGEGTFNVVLSTTSSTNTSLASRESGANAPQLVVITGGSAPAPTATKTPAGPTATKPPASPTATPVASLTKVSFKKGPDLILTGSNTSMKIWWQHTVNSTFRIDWGTSASYGSSTGSIGAYDATNHLFTGTLTNLTPGTRYYYRVVTGSQYSAGTFYTAPADSATALKFISYGDDRSNPSAHNTVAGQADKLFQSDPGYQTINPVVGDLVSSDSETAWTDEFFAPSLTNIRAEIANLSDVPVMGNHEGSGVLFNRYWPMPYIGKDYYSFDYGPAHFTMMNQYISYGSGSAEYNWVKNDLASSTKKWKIIVLHQPGWSANGGHPNDTVIQQVYEPIFEQYKVALVLGGHNHYYARAMVNGIAHLTVGTGGAPLYTPASGQPKIVKTYKGYGFGKFSISGSTLTGQFVNSSGSVQDTFTITR